MDGFYESSVSLLLFWAVEITLLVSTAAIACRCMKRRAGRHHAAVWTTALALAWVMPALPKLIADTVPLPQLVEPRIYPVITLPPGRFSATADNPAGNPARASGRTPQPLERRAAIQSPANTDPAPDARTALFWVWLAGGGITFLRWQWMRWKVHNQLRNARTVGDPRVSGIVERTRQLLFINQKIYVKSSDQKPIPFVCGLWRTTLYLPASLLDERAEPELRAVVAHELGHILRYDLLAHEAMSLLRVAFWFLPPVWWMQHELLRSQDSASDECATVIVGDGTAFGNALMNLAERCLIAQRLFPALGIIHTKHALLKRLEDIMKTQVATLSRLSLPFKSLLLAISFCFVFAAALVNQAASQQALRVTHLANYSGGENAVSIDTMVYADPYYAVVGRQNGRRTVQYMQAVGGRLETAFKVVIDINSTPTPISDYRFVGAVANDRLTIAFYEPLVNNNLDSIFYAVIDHKDRKAVIQNVSHAHVNNFALPRLEGNTLYFLDRTETVINSNDRKEDFLVRVEDVGTDESRSQRFTVPTHILVQDMAVINGDVLIVDAHADEDDPAGTGVVRVSLGDNSQLVIPGDRWFGPPDGWATWTVQSFQNTVLVNRMKPESSDRETLVVDWSDPTNPAVTQIFDTGIMVARPQGEAQVVNERLLAALQPNRTGKMNLLQWNTDRFEPAAELPMNHSYLLLGGEFLLNYDAKGIKAFDIADAQDPKEVAVPLSSSLDIFLLAAQEYYTYFVRDGELKVLDAALPNDLKTVGSYPLLNPQSLEVNAHHGLLAVINDALDTFALSDDGLIRTKIDLSEVKESYVPGQGYERVTAVDWNDNFFVFRVSRLDNPDMPLSSPRHYELKVHRRSGDTIETQPVSTINIADNTSQSIRLHDDLLFTFHVEYEIDTTVGGWNYFPYLSIYSLESPDRPVQLSKYLIPQVLGTLDLGFFVQDVSVHNDFLAYADNKQCGVIDIRDPANPVHLETVFSEGTSVFWYKDLVGFCQNNREIVFYRIQDRRELVEVARFQTGASRRPVLTGNRLYIPVLQYGLDMYQLSLNETGILDWGQYK